ncbi:MAG TPA: GNAT family N-acetyltransferase [Anaerolineales bacterium]|jgi:ribosomal protein S18 acetylase RimI-like enzyme
MQINFRPYCSEYDYYKIREFLCATLLLHDRKPINWPLYRWDYWRWHVTANYFKNRLEEVVFLGETQDGELAAVLNPEGPGEGFLQIHPRYRTDSLVREMLTIAEKKFPVTNKDGETTLSIWAFERDSILQAALAKNEYTKTNTAEYIRWQFLDVPIPEIPLPDGYILRPHGDDSDLPARSWASWRAFHPEEPDSAYAGWEWYRNIQRAPSYRRDLDLLAIAPGGEVAAFATVWYDEITRTGAFEPVGTQPQHQRKGLAKALLAEGLRRMQKMGAVMAYVSSYSAGAHATYESVGFNKYDLLEMWQKTF